MNDEHEQDYKDASIAVVGPVRAAMGLSIIPHPIKGDMEWIRKLNTCIDRQRAEIARLKSIAGK